MKFKGSDKGKLQVLLGVKGVSGGLGHKKMTNEASFQIRIMDAPCTCFPFSFELGKTYMSCDWLANT